MYQSFVRFKRLHKPNSPRSFEINVTQIGKYLGASNGIIVVVDTTTAGKCDGAPDFYDYFETSKASDSIKELMALAENMKQENAGWRKVPDVDSSKLKTCRECDDDGRVNVTNGPCKECEGEGVVQFENKVNEYSFDCKSCEGTGESITGQKVNCSRCYGSKHHKDHIPILESGDGFALNAQIIDALHGVDNLEAVWVKGSRIYALRFDNGFGIAFPMSV